jgi:SAM-dependent methyltransferase
MANFNTRGGAAAHTPAPASRSTPTLLRVDPSFVQSQTLDGRPFVAKDAEPYTQFWLSERERIVLAQFAGRRGAREFDATAGYLRMTGVADTAMERRRIATAVASMRGAGLLVPASQDSSRYGEAITADYIAHRPFPREIAAHITQAGSVGADSAVLDLAGGPGDLALALAQTSRRVSLMELSKAFLKAASRRAREQGLALTTVHDSCNRLVHHELPYDVVTVSQALHWLDDVAVCRGLCRLLLPDGSFFVVHAAMEVPDTHPLAHLLGYDSILGAHPRRPFADEVQPLLRRLQLLFEALDAPDVQRVDPLHGRSADGGSQRIAPAGVQLFSQTRPFGPGFARGFFTAQHIAVSGMKPEDFWADLQARCAAVPEAACSGIQHWAVLHFKRGATGIDVQALRERPVQAIGFEGPTGI